MIRRRYLPFAMILAAFFSQTAGAAADSQAAWNALVEDYFNEILLKFNPSSATLLGFHEYDGKIEDRTSAGINAEIDALAKFEKRVAAFSPAGLNSTDAADREMLLGSLRSSILTLRVFRPWQKDPDTYSGIAANSVYVVMDRKFAPADERLRSAVAREKQIPALFAAAKLNLKNPARIHTEIALEQLPGIIGFFEKDVPIAFTDAKDPALRTEFEKSNAAVVGALRDYEAWLKKDLLPRSNGDFRIGAENFSKKLLYEESVNTPLDKLLEIGMADLHKNQADFQRIAKEVDSSKSAKEVLAELGTTHPSADKLLQSFRDTFDGLIAFINEKHIITLPTNARPILQPTPPFERATTTASMDTPGPFEKVATESFFNVTLPDATDSPEDVASLLEAYNRGTIVSTSVHEAFPGHFVQFLYTPFAPTKLRKVLGANTNGEGWAHYCEQMMLEEGYGQPGVGANDVRESRLIHLGQLQDALLRDARFVVGIQLHRGKMSIEQAKEFFVNEGYQTPKIAEIETKRGTSDPTYLYYTLGKLEILKLREDLKKKQGSAFSLQKFHDEFQKQGYPPISIVRKAMLGDDSPVL